MKNPAEFRLMRPATIGDAIQAFIQNDDALYLAGGTDLIANIRRGIKRPRALIELNTIREMRGIERVDGGLRIGANTTLAELVASSDLVGAHAVLARAASLVAGPTHREVATLGGNLSLDTRCVYYNQSEWWRSANDYCLKSGGEVCHVAPNTRQCFACYSGDIAPAALVLGAKVGLAGPEGARTIPLQDLYREDGADHLSLRRGEIVTDVFVPVAPSLRTGYEKVRVRGAVDFPLAGVAVALHRDADKLSGLSIAFTGTNSRPLLVEGTAALTGTHLDAVALGKLVARQIKPMRSTSISYLYRRKVASNVARTLALRLWTGD
ncbi:MAG: 4-hydroxybenzoyl-CoA reductase subunit beta [Pseudorhodoplanes sp.]|jgi:4-hydroxybenzoyl-CoA reductase subunit beta|nr:4-hydroxybenzoyl-CoA reductase subunit beta [Pseudorhodoplanes sp.]